MKFTHDNNFLKKIGKTVLRFSGFLLSLMLLGIIVFLIYKPEVQNETVNVLVAKESIPSQTSISPDMLTTISYDKAQFPSNGLLDREIQFVLGKKAIVSIQKGDIISPSFFGTTNKSINGGSANLIPESKRLIYLTNNDVHIFPPDIQKDNFIDLIAINKDIDAKEVIQIVSTTVPVFDVVKTKENENEFTSSIGLIVTIEQNERIAEKLNGGWQIQIVMRSQNEVANIASPSAVLKVNPTVDDEK